MQKLIRSYNKLLQIQLFRYFIVGGVATVVDWSSFYLLAIKINFNYQAALVIAFILGSVTNYVFNKIFTFRCRSKQIAGQMTVHLMISAISLLLNMGMMYIFVSSFAIAKMPSRMIITVIMLVINFFMHKHLTFNKKIFKESAA